MKKLQNQLLKRLSIEEFKNVKKTPLIVVLDNVRSMHNIGSVFRTSDAFLVEEVHLCGITAIPPHKDIHKTALGSTESVTWKYFKETTNSIHQLKNTGYTLLAIEQTDSSIPLDEYSFDVDKKYALIFGHEVRGVGQNTLNSCDTAIEVPQFGTKHSLNISVCAGIVIWEIFKKIRN